MKLGKVRIGERLVFDDRGGVFQRVSWDKVRCIYGSNFGTELDINPEVSVYAIFDKEKGTRTNKPVFAENEGTEVQSSVVVDTAVSVPEIQRDHASEYQSPCGGSVSSVKSAEGTIRVIFIDEHDKILTEIPVASAVQVSALTRADFIRMKVPNKDTDVFRVTDVGFDSIEQTLCLSIEERDV